MSLVIGPHRSKKPTRHDKLVPRTYVCNLCRGIAGIDSRCTHMHHDGGRLKHPHGPVIEICECCHNYIHALEGTGANNAPRDPEYALIHYLNDKNMFMEGSEK